jgi:hypothetical protein
MSDSRIPPKHTPAPKTGKQEGTGYGWQPRDPGNHPGYRVADATGKQFLLPVKWLVWDYDLALNEAEARNGIVVLANWPAAECSEMPPDGTPHVVITQHQWWEKGVRRFNQRDDRP